MNVVATLLAGVAAVAGIVHLLRDRTQAVPDGGEETRGPVWAFWERLPGLTTTGKPHGLARIFTSVDHKDIGLLYLLFAIAAGLWGGTDAMMLRAELMTPGPGIWDARTYNEVFTMHGITMLFFFVTPAFAGFANYFLPLLIGADDMAFPRINAIAFWLLPFSLVLARGGLIVDVVGKVLAPLGIKYAVFHALKPPDVGWTLYVPLSIAKQQANPQVSLLLLALHLSGLATIMAGINFIVTVFTERAEDVTWANLDIFTWAILTMSALILFAFPLLGSALIMLLLDGVVGMNFFSFDPAGGAILWQHLFWFFGHPEVYILVLPAFGLTSLILPKFCGRKLFGYKFVVYTTLAIGVLSFGVWAHHMFSTGIDPRVRASFMIITIAIAVPSAVKTFNWMATMWNGAIRLEAPLLFLVGGISLFIVGGITGVFLASIPVDLLLHDTYYVTGHFHLIIMGIIPFTMFAASYYWYPLFTGKWYDKTLGVIHAVLLTVGTWVTFGTLVVMGMSGLPRRYAEYPAKYQAPQVLASFGALLIFAGVNVWIYNMVQSYRVGEDVDSDDPWDLKPSGQYTREWEWWAENRE